MKIREWFEKNCTDIENEWFNGVNYKFGTMKDGWIAAVEVCEDEYRPIIQSKCLESAKAYCALIKPITVPFELI